MVRPTKRSKINDDDSGKNKVVVEPELIEKVWDHYRNFLDSCCEEDEEGDVDELYEIVTLTTNNNTTMSNTTSDDNDDDKLLGNGTRKDLFPILLSMTHYHLANHLITQTIDVVTTTKDDDDEAKEEDLILKEFQLSLHYFPSNCATWSVGTNYARMKQLVSSPVVLCRWFQYATQFASKLRTRALELLDDEEDDEIEKEWLELLILNGMVGTEYIDDMEEEEEDEQIDDDDDTNKVTTNSDDEGEKEEEGEEKKDDSTIQQEEDDKDNDSNNSQKEEDDGYFSSSSVEATSRFMGAMMQSTCGNHDVALDLLQHFDITHRLHPNVWQSSSISTTTTTTTTIDEDGDDDAPTLYTGGVLPPQLYQQMCRTFGPNSEYWKESNYAHRGYHSYFIDLQQTAPKNVIEDVIITHLLPLAQRKTTTKIVGAEWWPHTRPIRANLGHNLHFDTDESILAREGVVSHPILSSVLYLTTGSASAGSTIILQQTPDSKAAASKCWSSCRPQNNTALFFHGNQLHGVLPCPGKESPEEEEEASSNSMQWDNTTTSKNDDEQHRLTFMVGFWTRSVPEQMVPPPMLYGPCGPLPPIKSTKWVQQIHETYHEKTTKPKLQTTSTSIKEESLPTISPAWESINTTANDNDILLEIPRAIDHRFFVKGVPECFRQSLFEKDDDDALQVFEEDEEEEDEES